MDRSSMRPRRRLPQVAVPAGLLAAFGAALVGAASWPPETTLYPRVVSLAGIVLSLVLLVDGVLGRSPAAETPGEDDPAAVFARTGRRDWLPALAWVAAFLTGLVVAGLYATVLVFTVAYLRVAAAAGWVLAVSYAVVASGMLYAGAGVLLHVPVPQGLLW